MHICSSLTETQLYGLIDSTLRLSIELYKKSISSTPSPRQLPSSNTSSKPLPSSSLAPVPSVHVVAAAQQSEKRTIASSYSSQENRQQVSSLTQPSDNISPVTSVSGESSREGRSKPVITRKATGCVIF
jgi:hypothetical protein